MFNYSLIFSLVLAFVAALGLCVVLNWPAYAFGLVDAPDRRKRHKGTIPLTGGLAMFLAFGLGVMVADFQVTEFESLFFGSLVLMALGLTDDIFDISVRIRLLVQILVAVIMVLWAELAVHGMGDLFGFGAFGMGPFAAVFTITAVVFMTNAINMLDGMDGLAGGVSLVIFLAMAVVALIGGVVDARVVALVLVAALSGFLVLNMRSPLLHRARVFMGDGGSMLLGFAAAWMAVYLSESRTANIPAIVVAWVVVVPALDMMSLFFRRLLNGKSPLSPDRTHLHHLLRRSGFSVSQSVWIIIALTAGCASFGIGAWLIGLPEWVLGWGMVGAFAGYFVFIREFKGIMRWLLRRKAQGARLKAQGSRRKAKG